MKSLRNEFVECVNAGDAAIRVNTDELNDAVHTLGAAAKEMGWSMRLWDHVNGEAIVAEAPKYGAAKKYPVKEVKKYVPGMGPGGVAASNNAEVEETQSVQVKSPHQQLIAFLRELPLVPGPDAEDDNDTVPNILVVRNAHRVIEAGNLGVLSATVQHVVGDTCGDVKLPKGQSIQDLKLDPGSPTGKVVVFLMPATEHGQAVDLPSELVPLFSVIEHDLPDLAELKHLFDQVMPADPESEGDERQGWEVKDTVCRNLLGLTRVQAEGVLCKATTRHGKWPGFNDKLLRYTAQKKSEILNREGLVVPYTGSDTFADIVGNEGMKRLIVSLLRPDPVDPDNPDFRARGVCIVGPPRTGKSATIKALGNETGVPVYQCDVGALMGGFVGDTERNTRRFFRLLRTLAPCIAWIDELEKVMPRGRGQSTSGGVDTRLAGTFMTMMQDIKEPVFWAFTANSIRELHEAFLDDDRVDLKFYVKMPTAEQLAAGWRMNISRFFPRTEKGKRAAEGIELDLETVMARIEGDNAKKPTNRTAADLTAILQSTVPDEREAILDRVGAVSPELRAAVADRLVDDSGWTIARVKTVCRLARKLQQPIHVAAGLVPQGVEEGRDGAIRDCERWATRDRPVDAETGLIYQPTVAESAAYEEEEPSRVVLRERRGRRRGGKRTRDE